MQMYHGELVHGSLEFSVWNCYGKKHTSRTSLNSKTYVSPSFGPSSEYPTKYDDCLGVETWFVTLIDIRGGAKSPFLNETY